MSLLSALRWEVSFGRSQVWLGFYLVDRLLGYHPAARTSVCLCSPFALLPALGPRLVWSFSVIHFEIPMFEPAWAYRYYPSGLPPELDSVGRRVLFSNRPAPM